MKKASPVQLRKALEIANQMVKTGVNFVCMPVVDEADYQNLVDQSVSRLERIVSIAESSEKSK